MENLERNVVYHGSPVEFGTVKPKENKRLRFEDGKEVITFQDISFHATPHKWIALAYALDGKQLYECDGKQACYNMGVSLFENNMTVVVYGVNSLEESLEKLYGKRGYIYEYDAEHFFYTEGLGPLEVITKKEIDPLKSEYIENPIEEMKKLGVKFEFVDLRLPENEHMRDYIT